MFIPLLLIATGGALAVRQLRTGQPAPIGAGPAAAPAIEGGGVPVEDSIPAAVPQPPASRPEPSNVGGLPEGAPEALGGAVLGAGLGAAVAEFTDSNAVVSGVATGAGGIAGAAVVTLGAVAAAPVVAGAAVVFGAARLVQDLFELSVGREDAMDAYRAMLDKAPDREEARRLAHEENARRYLQEMAEPRWFGQDDATHLRYRTDRGQLLGQPVAAFGQLGFEGWVYDFRTGSTAPVVTPQVPSAPTAAQTQHNAIMTDRVAARLRPGAIE